jgi:hypothetical protein
MKCGAPRTNVEALVERFFESLSDPAAVLYNEASLQHELAFFLRPQLPDGWRLYFERPVASFRPGAARLVKKEIDLALADPAGGAVIAIEMKCPRQGQHPEQMFRACQDLLFLEQLVSAGSAESVLAAGAPELAAAAAETRAHLPALFWSDGLANQRLTPSVPDLHRGLPHGR